MGYSSGYTAVTGATYTASNYNTYVRDNLAAIWVFTAAGDLIYATGANTASRLPIGTPGQVLTVVSGAPAWRGAKLVVQMQVVPDQGDVDTSVVGYFYIPSTLNGASLVRAEAFVTTAGATGATTIQIRNLTKYPSNDALSTAISIASGGTVGTEGTVNTSFDDLSTNDKIRISVTAASTTKAKGLVVILEYQLP